MKHILYVLIFNDVFTIFNNNTVSITHANNNNHRKRGYNNWKKFN